MEKASLSISSSLSPVALLLKSTHFTIRQYTITSGLSNDVYVEVFRGRCINYLWIIYVEVHEMTNINGCIQRQMGVLRWKVPLRVHVLGSQSPAPPGRADSFRG